jgi:hypothetical protein
MDGVWLRIHGTRRLEEEEQGGRTREIVKTVRWMEEIEWNESNWETGWFGVLAGLFVSQGG